MRISELFSADDLVVDFDPGDKWEAIRALVDHLEATGRLPGELSDEVLWAHVDLYVDERTVELGDTGRRALAQLARLAREAGQLADGAELEIART